MIEIKNKRFYDGPGRYVGRPTPLGNPYSHLKSKDPGITIVKDRDEACDSYEFFFYEYAHDGEFYKQFESLVEEYRKLGHLVLICWCAPQRCHAETIREAIYQRIKNENNTSRPQAF